MSSTQPEKIDALILGYLDGRIGKQDFDRLREAMRSDVAVMDRFVELSALDRSIQSTLLESRQIETVQHARLHSESTGESFEELLAQLAVGSDQAEMVHIVSLPGPSRWKLPLAISGAIAAVLAVAVTLIVVLSAGPATSPTQFVWDDDLSIKRPISPTIRPSVVATLTATHNAQWDSQPAEDLRRGSDLHPGQTLTLTAGFAEVTTNDGTVAILEAPATVELLDNDNALRLHSGKLVGICETESSKGFLVRTPRMDITDLGTRFGVSVDETGGAMVQVFEGRVATKSNRAIGEQALVRELVSGESLAVNSLGEEQAVGDAMGTVFTSLRQRLCGISQLAGQVQWVESDAYLGTDPSTWPKRDHAVVLQETQGFTLTKPLELSSVSPIYDEAINPLASGTTINTYILVYSPGDRTQPVAEGQIVFDGEILGVIINEQWHPSLRVLQDGSGAKRLASNANAVIEDDFDTIDLQPDGHTLSFKLKAQIAHDAVRIVVREPIGEAK